MIIFSCEAGQGIVIGDDISIDILEIRGDRVRLGIDHPPEIPVYRREVFDVIQREMQTAQRPR